MSRQLAIKQAFLPGMDQIQDALDVLSESEGEQRGAIYTNSEVVSFILDLIGYRPNKRLFDKRLLEPSFGHGSFLLPVVDRLLASWRRYGSGDPDQIIDSILAVELHRESFESTYQLVVDRLIKSGISRSKARQICSKWLVQSDFLLLDISGSFEFVAGNPPYLRIERISRALMKEYRARFKTMYDRADIYIPFIERSLDLLKPDGKLGFICADRWTKNRYGGPLRAKIAKSFHLETFVDMNGVDAFSSGVIAYPAITIISKGASGPTQIVTHPNTDLPSLASLSRNLSSGQKENKNSISIINDMLDGSAPWVFTRCSSNTLVKYLEAKFPTIEETGCKVGIGVATGADRVFIAPFDQLDVELDRKLPLATTKDIASGKVEWHGLGVINPFLDSGQLVALDDYPKLKAHLLSHKQELCKRHVAKKSAHNWFRTIDRIHRPLTNMPKLLIPDIKGMANVVVEEGGLYPHHNLYFIVSEHWNMHALSTVLGSGIAQLFVANYSTKMRGGYLRFQAQHLRRIRLPKWESVNSSLRARLIKASQTSERVGCVDLVAELYGLSSQDRDVLEDHMGKVNS